VATHSSLSSLNISCQPVMGGGHSLTCGHHGLAPSPPQEIMYQVCYLCWVPGDSALGRGLGTALGTRPRALKSRISGDRARNPSPDYAGGREEVQLTFLRRLISLVLGPVPALDHGERRGAGIRDTVQQLPHSCPQQSHVWIVSPGECCVVELTGAHLNLRHCPIPASD
jgi:hypothetical protein